MSWADLVALVLRHMDEGAPPSWAAIRARCAELLLRAGPTPARGPLSHDLVWAGDKRGVNCFDGPEFGGWLCDGGGVREKRYRLGGAGEAEGFDLVDGLAVRHRVYRRVGQLPGWPPRLPGESHRLLVERPGEKTARNIIFQTAAELGPLRELLDPPWLRPLERAVHAAGWRLLPVAWEEDHWEDGRVEAEILVALGSPRP